MAMVLAMELRSNISTGFQILLSSITWPRSEAVQQAAERAALLWHQDRGRAIPS